MLTKKLEATTKISNPMAMYSCEYYGGGHTSLECQGGFSQDSSIEHLNAFNNFQRNQGNLYSNTYNPGWRNHPNFLWSNQGGVQNNNLGFKQTPYGFQQKTTFPQQGEPKFNLKVMMEKFLKNQERYQKDQEKQREAIKNPTSQVG